MSYSPDPSLPWAAFRQACRAFRPSELVHVIARKSASLGEPPYGKAVTHGHPPWGLAAAARESLVFGNEYRSKAPDASALAALMRKFQIAMDISDAEARSQQFLLSLTTRMAHEQLPYQESMFEEVARSHAWMVQGLDAVPTKVITQQGLADMLDGVTLREAIGATFFLQVGAFQNHGIYDPGWLDQPNFTEVLEIYPRHTIETMARRLTTTVTDFKAAYQRHAVGTPSAARFDYNPLVATPFIDLGDGPVVAPATRLILRTVSPGGLYYAGLAHHGTPFAEDLGHLFEHYVGRQLKLIEEAEVHPEVVFGKGGGNKSVDWFVIMPKLVLLIEVKSRRLGPAAQAGDPKLIDALTASLGEARDQLGRTIDHLAQAHPAFVHIPTDRPMVAFIVTAEPFYSAGAYLMDHTDGPTIPGRGLPDVPVGAVSARQLESLVTHGAEVEDILLDLLAGRGNGVIGLLNVAKKQGTQNPILEKAWDSYPWPERPSTNGPHSEAHLP